MFVATNERGPGGTSNRGGEQGIMWREVPWAGLPPTCTKSNIILQTDYLVLLILILAFRYAVNTDLL